MGNGAEEEKEEQPDFFGGIDPQLLSKIMQLLPLLQSKGDDERTRLIAALKPLLSEQRKRKADEAIQLIRMLELLPLLQNGL